MKRILTIIVILVAFTACTKENTFNPEVPPADLRIKQKVYKLVYPQHGQGCDTLGNKF